MKNTIKKSRRRFGDHIMNKRTHAALAAALALIIILGWVTCGTGCAANHPDLDALHAELTAREGTPHYDHWSTTSQQEWETAFRRASP